MHRVDTPGSVTGSFVNGNAPAGIEGTIADAAWLNAVQEEPAAVIEGEGMTLDKSDQTQLKQAIEKLVRRLSGSILDYTAGSALTAGDVDVVGDTVGIVKATVGSGAAAELLCGGEHQVPKASGDTFSTIGARAWWDATAGEVKDAAATGRRQIGCFAAAAGSGTTQVLVRVDGVARPAEP